MTTITFIHHKKEITMNVVRLTLYKQARIIDAIDQNNQCFTAIFYKNKFINAKKTNAINLQSFIKNAYCNGNKYPSTHPLTKAFLSIEKKYRLTTSNQMFQHLKEKYSDIEMLYVLSMFDNYLDNKKVQALCKKIFYHYRRNGQLMNAYRTIINYVQIRPTDRFAKDMLYHMDFQKYHDKYQQINELINNWDDPIFIESTSIQHKSSKSFTNQLFHLYTKEDRWFDAIALSFRLFQSKNPPFDPNEIDHFEVLLSKIPNEENIISFWAELLKLDPQSEKILQKLAERNAHEPIFSNIISHNISARLSQFEAALTSVPADCLLKHKEKVFPFILEHYQGDQAKMEKLIHHSMKKLLPHLSISEMLEEIQEIELPITQKLKNMKRLEQNPDQQYALGELYYQLEQYERAINCFEWEMELSPDDPKPIQYLHKSYLAIGDKETAKNYQDLLMNVKSRSKTS